MYNANEAPAIMNPLTVHDFAKKKMHGEKISMLTAYDASQARLLAQSNVDCLLVGDSLAMIVHGFESTVHATVAMMRTHTEAVVRGAKAKKFIVADMPFLSVRKGFKSAMQAVEALMQAGANAVKIEGLKGHQEIISHIVESGVPVMGHLGLMPQSVNATGGFKLQAKTASEQDQLKADALALQELGAFSVVLECIPSSLGAEVTRFLKIPTIGIGAGSSTDGQVLVYHDVLGLNGDFRPKFLKNYLNGQSLQVEAFNRFCSEVKSGVFPSEKESYYS